MSTDPTSKSDSDPTVRRLRPLGETIFATMSRLTQETGAINLGQGYPDRDGPQIMPDEAADAIRRGGNQYVPGRGTGELRGAICEDRRRRLGRNWNPDTECLVTVDATEGITAGVLGLVEPGTLVVLIERFYNSYRAEAILAGAKWTAVPLVTGDDGWRLDVAALRDAVRDDTTMIIINTPHSPTGTIFTRIELEAIADVALDSGAFVLAEKVDLPGVFTPMTGQSIVGETGLQTDGVLETTPSLGPQKRVKRGPRQPPHRESAETTLHTNKLLAGSDLLSHTLPGAVPSAQVGLASGFGMGPGVTPPL